MMSASVTAFLYLVAGVLFILALRGLSHPETSRQGNRFGMIGMAIAVPSDISTSAWPWMSPSEPMPKACGA